MENTETTKELFDSLYLSEKHLTAGQTQFINSARKQFRRNKSLSEKQIKVLRDIKKYLPAQDARFSGVIADNKKHNLDKIIIWDM
jgi:hypothetical protein